MTTLENSKLKRIVLTGAPSTGKSSVMKELKREFGDKVLLVPESAVVLLSGGYPPPQHADIEQIRCFQQAILHVQAGLEFSLPRQNPGAEFMVFDRGSLDGAGFWPNGPADFLNYFQVDLQNEYAKFTDVLFLQLPTPEMFGGINDLRFHNFEQSLLSEKQLEEVWQGHTRFKKVPAQPSLEEKIKSVVSHIKQILL